MNVTYTPFVMDVSALKDASLAGIDPHDVRLSPEIKERIAAECKINPAFFTAVTKSGYQSKDKVENYHLHLQKKIVLFGHVVQGVFPAEDGSAGGFMYTIGRNDRSRADIFVDVFDDVFHTLLNEAAEVADSPDFQLGKPYQSAVIVTARDVSQHSRYKLVEISAEAVRTKALGLFNRGKPAEQLRVHELIMADADNKFDDER